MADLSQRNLKELQQLARNQGIPYSGLRKAELIERLQGPEFVRVQKRGLAKQAQGLAIGATRGTYPIQDTFGKQIFDVFVKKYKADKIFEREYNRVLDLYNKSRLLTVADRDFLIGIISQFKDLFENFVDRVDKERKFVEKSGYGKPPRDIVTAVDWAETIIELQGIVDLFFQNIRDNIKLRADPSKLTTYCEKQPLEQCVYPCKKKKQRVGKDKCIY